MTEQLNITSRSLYSIPFISNSHIHYIHSVNRTHYISRLMYNHAFLTIRSAQTRLLLLITWTNPKVNDGLFGSGTEGEKKGERGRTTMTASGLRVGLRGAGHANCLIRLKSASLCVWCCSGLARCLMVRYAAVFLSQYDIVRVCLNECVQHKQDRK